MLYLGMYILDNEIRQSVFRRKYRAGVLLSSDSGALLTQPLHLIDRPGTNLVV